MSDNEVIEKIASLLISLLILANGFIIKQKKGTWLYPGALFSLFWFAFTFFPLVILFKEPIEIKSQLYIFLATLLFSNSYRVHDCFLGLFKKQKPKTVHYEFLNRPFLLYSMIGFILISIIGVCCQLKIHGFTLKYFFSNPFEFAEEYSKLRYSLKLENNIFNFASFLGAYVSAVLGGIIYFFFPKDKNKYYSFICFLPSLIIMFTQSAKGPFFLSLFLFLGTGFAWKVKNNKFLLFNRKNIILSVKWGLIFFVLLVASFLSRGLYRMESYHNIIIKLKYLFFTYFLAHIYAFSDWFNSFLGFESLLEYDNEINGYGYYTFNFITRYYDSNKEPIRGVYGEYFGKEDYFISCVYTIYRGLIMDFGLLGSLVAVFVFGYICHAIYDIYIKGKFLYFSLPAMIFMFVFFYMSFMGSYFYWTVNFITFLIVLILLTINFIYAKTRN